MSERSNLVASRFMVIELKVLNRLEGRRKNFPVRFDLSVTSGISFQVSIEKRVTPRFREGV